MRYRSCAEEEYQCAKKKKEAHGSSSFWSWVRGENKQNHVDKKSSKIQVSNLQSGVDPASDRVSLRVGLLSITLVTYRDHVMDKKLNLVNFELHDLCLKGALFKENGHLHAYSAGCTVGDVCLYGKEKSKLLGQYNFLLYMKRKQVASCRAIYTGVNRAEESVSSAQQKNSPCVAVSVHTHEAVPNIQIEALPFGIVVGMRSIFQKFTLCNI